MMLTFEAAKTIRRMAKIPGAEGLRIFRAGHSLAGRGVDLEMVPATGPEPDNTIVELDGAPPSSPPMPSAR